MEKKIARHLLSISFSHGQQKIGLPSLDF